MRFFNIFIRSTAASGVVFGVTFGRLSVFFPPLHSAPSQSKRIIIPRASGDRLKRRRRRDKMRGATRHALNNICVYSFRVFLFFFGYRSLSRRARAP